MMSVALYEVMKLLAKERFTKLLGIMYIFLGCMALIIMRKTNINYVIFPFAVVWSCDTFAYFIGVKFGKHKMSPKISPKKSWEGTIGGVTIATIIGTIVLSFITPNIPTFGAVLLSFECAVLTVLGDLLESAVKRQKGVKDSGNIIPGHGGVLDRIDSLIPVSLLVFMWIAILTILQR